MVVVGAVSLTKVLTTINIVQSTYTSTFLSVGEDVVSEGLALMAMVVVACLAPDSVEVVIEVSPP